MNLRYGFGQKGRAQLAAFIWSGAIVTGNPSLPAMVVAEFAEALGWVPRSSLKSLPASRKMSERPSSNTGHRLHGDE